MDRSLIWVVATLATLGFGCNHTEDRAAPQLTSGSAPYVAASGVAPTQADPNFPTYGCPTALPGTVATVTDTENGVVVTFTGPTNEAVALRSRVRWLADQHGRWMQGVGPGGMPPDGMTMMQGCPCMQGGGGMMHGHGMMMGMGMPGYPSDVTAVDVENGARLVFTARNRADVAALQGDVRARVGRMTSGWCPMM